jgi:hypothetical protein
MAEKRNSGGGIASLFREAGAKAKLHTTQLLNEQAAALVAEMTDSDEPRVNRPKLPPIFSVLEYIESSWGLNMPLYPVQRFLVKLYYHLPLNDRDKTIEVTDMLKSKVLHRFTEKEYLKFLYEEGRCNIGEQDHERRELVLAIGRRAGKTTLSGIFASYEVYRLLNMHHPQGYYGLPPGNRIQIISVATDKDQAGLLFNEVTAHLARCDYFKPFIASNTQSDIKFRTPHDIEKFGTVQRFENGKFQSLNGKATLRVTFKSCVAKGLRGSGNVIVILDEMAHFLDQGQSSASDIYNAVTPSTAAFSPKDPNDPSKPVGPVEARVIAISSPLNKAGKFYELFSLAMSKGPGSENLLAIQAPTWEVNPTIDPAYYRQKYHADPAVFMTEHGAMFSDRVRGWIEREQDLIACVDPLRRPMQIGAPRLPHQMGIDVGLMGDGTAFAITYQDGDNVALAYHEYWVAGEDWRVSNPHLADYSCPYARTLADTDQLDFDEIADWIVALTKRFYITSGLFDRWNGLPLQQALIKKGLPQFTSEFFTRDATSKMYQAAKMLMIDQKLSLYDYPIPPKEDGAQSRHSPLISELLTLQAEQFSRNVVVVSAPEQKGNHDDMSDALIRAVWQTMERMTTTKTVFGSRGDRGGKPLSPAAVGRYQMKRARAHGGFTERTIPKNIGLGRGPSRGRTR